MKASKLKLENKRFGKITVVKRVGIEKRSATWLCKCDCGNEVIFTSYQLINNIIESCGCHKKPDGLIFGFLTVIKKLPKSKAHRTLWQCKCVCGNIKNIRADSLKAKEVISCGCMNPRKIHTTPETTKLSSAKLVHKTIYSDGNLTFEQFLELSQKNCYYCGAPPSNKANAFKRDKRSTQFTKENGNFIYNGLDRVDNNLPHNFNNLVPCCFPCNWSKGKRNIDDFKNWAMDISINLCKNDNNKLIYLYNILKSMIIDN